MYLFIRLINLFIIFTIGENNGKLPLEVAQDAAYQSHTGRLTGLWFLPN